ncbi:MAG: autotransporter outer membrane beta-barrel domain-containing protein, partial [Stenotrophomonas sp.]|nr:autotransporter outer membrane beta-barrel domain-containing protein [Stenotrophomonas sp.]
MRSLACAVAFALVSLPHGAMSEVLDGETLVLNPDSSIEEWTLLNGAQLIVDGAGTRSIDASQNSRVQMQGAAAQVDDDEQDVVRLRDTAVLEATSSTFRGGSVHLSGNSSAHLVNSAVLVTRADGLDPTGLSVGVDITSTDPSHGARVVLDSTRVRVEDSTGGINSGLGVRMTAGQVDIVNGARIEADNIGVQLFSRVEAADPLRLRIDNATVQSGRGAAINVASMHGVENSAEIVIANGAQLIAGDGNLLLMQTRDGSVDAGRIDVDFTVDDARLGGNVTFDTRTMNGTLDVTLRNNARIDGRFINVSRADIGTNSTWML